MSQEKTVESILTIDNLFKEYKFSPKGIGKIQWMEDGNSYTITKQSDNKKGVDIWRYDANTKKSEILLEAKNYQLKGNPIRLQGYTFTKDLKKALIYTNSKKVWRAYTKGDYWIYNMENGNVGQLGTTLPSSSLMFAKLSPNQNQAAYVSENNLFVEDIATQKIKKLTNDGTIDVINGTFDWAYEEEFACRDGFRWNADGSLIAYWQVDATDIKDFVMINNTDDVYAKVIPFQYPKVGETPSSAKIGVVNVETGKTVWMKIEGNPYQHYLPRMQWIPNSNKILVRQLNRKQNELKIWVCDAETGESKVIYSETEKAWIDIDHPDATSGWDMIDLIFLNNNKQFILLSDKDGWRHAYLISIDGKKEKLLTNGEYDVAHLHGLDIKQKNLYFNASPGNGTQRYLYKVSMKKNTIMERITPEKYSGINKYNMSPNLEFAVHNFSSLTNVPNYQLINIKNHEILKILQDNLKLRIGIKKLDLPETEFFKVTTVDGVELDGFMIKPLNFDPNKKYPVLFHVYGEPWSQTALDSWNLGWHTMLAQKGYLVITMDNRGTPSLKGREWRKSIYRNIGKINARDQAMAAKEILKWDFVDADRTAVWGWSGGGSMTLNLLFQYPEIYKTGIAVAAVSNQLIYDNIYQERYMGLPQENKQDFIDGSPITYAKDLEGNLLIIHGTGDDNVHYQSAEMVINELIKHNKMFQIMPYPNRSHSISEGANTRRHLYTLMTKYLMDNCPVE